MALSGTLGDFSLTDILQLIGLQRKTGVLVLRHADEEVSIGFDSGRVVSAESNRRPAEKKVGQLLVRTGKLTEDRLEQALRKQQATLQRLGHVLVEAKWVDKETIRRQLVLQITDTVYDLFRWKDGEYDFQPGAAVEWDRGFVQPIPAENLLMEGARIVDEWPLVERVIPSRSIVLCVTEKGRRLFSTGADAREARGSVYDEDMDLGIIPANPLAEETGTGGAKLDNRQRAVLRWVDGHRSAGDIAELSGLGNFDAFQTMAELVDAGLVETREDEVTAADAAPARVRGLLRVSGLPRALTAAVAVLAVLGVLAALQEVVRAVVPGGTYYVLPMTSPVASHAALTATAKLDQLRGATSAERLARLEEAAVVHFLDVGEWPASIADLVHRGLVPEYVTVDPWGDPYLLEVQPWGLRLQEPPHPDRTPLQRERRFSAVERTGDAPLPAA